MSRPCLTRRPRLNRRAGGTRRLRVSHAFHSSLMDGMLAEFTQVGGHRLHPSRRVSRWCQPSPASWPPPSCCQIPATGRNRSAAPSRFADAASRLAEHGMTAFLELGPDGVLSAAVRETLGGDAGPDDDPGLGGDVGLGGGPAAQSGTGPSRPRSWPRWPRPRPRADVDWAAVFAGAGARRVDLPTYPFQRQRFWAAQAAPAPAAAGGDGAGDGEFWSAVERADLAPLGLDLDEGVVAALSSWHQQAPSGVPAGRLAVPATWRPLAGLPGSGPGRTDEAGDPWLVLVPAGPDSPRRRRRRRCPRRRDRRGRGGRHQQGRPRGPATGPARPPASPESCPCSPCPLTGPPADACPPTPCPLTACPVRAAHPAAVGHAGRAAGPRRRPGGRRRCGA